MLRVNGKSRSLLSNLMWPAILIDHLHAENGLCELLDMQWVWQNKKMRTTLIPYILHAIHNVTTSAVSQDMWWSMRLRRDDATNLLRATPRNSLDKNEQNTVGDEPFVLRVSCAPQVFSSCPPREENENFEERRKQKNSKKDTISTKHILKCFEKSMNTTSSMEYLVYPVDQEHHGQTELKQQWDCPRDSGHLWPLHWKEVPLSPRTWPWLHCSPQVAFAPLLANPPWRLGTQMANL